MSAARDRAGRGGGLLATDFYQLTMLHAYEYAGMGDRATFEFFFRRPQPTRGFLLAAGLGTLAREIETAGFTPEEIAWLRETGRFPDEMIDRLAEWRFTGDLDAVAEGTLIFGDEPILRVEAPIAEAQLIETLVINHLHFQTLIASKAARMVLTAPDAQLIDFGLRRAHGMEAGVRAARAAYLAGFAGTATTSAGLAFAIPLYGTMAHSFIQAHDSEEQAFLDFALARPADTTLLIDTYDTERAAAKVVTLAETLRARGIAVRGVRIDSGDLAAHARAVRAILDEGGLDDVRIVASGGIDEWTLRDLVRSGAPIDSYGIGTSLTTSQDRPAIDCGYKLVAYAGTPQRKLSEGKVLWPGAKQLFRHHGGDGTIDHDVLALADEALDGEPLLRPAMREGRCLDLPTLEEARATARENLARLPDRLKDLDTPGDYDVRISSGLRALADSMAKEGR